MKWLQMSIAASMIAVVSCSDSTKPVDPASVATLSLTPAATPIVKGTQKQLTLSARDSTGNEVHVNALWTSNSPSVVTVSKDGLVTALGYGSAMIEASAGTHWAIANVVVTAPMSRRYSVLDLGVSLQVGSIIRKLSDSGDVVAGSYYRRGVATAIPGCPTPVTINGPGHVLCRTGVPDSVSSFAIWHNGALVPLTTVDTFKAGVFRAFAMSDSDEVAGMFWRPSFVNANCPASGDRCLAIWKNGSVSFPGYTAATADAMLMNNRGQVVLEQAMWAPSSPGLTSTIFNVTTGSRTNAEWGIHALNDNGWAAIQLPYVQPGDPSTSGSRADVMTPTYTMGLGNGGATGINNSNVVVGTLDVGAFIWRGDAIAMLTDAATDRTWTITAANEINNRGQILATADNSDGRKGHTVILTPTQP
jgi:hypothetical protein